ncbi:MAG: rhomboid family intramembrane serine protease [Dehalococcoidales bacterium]|nr:rhomboid family intramembrane serine protease [Dehalococcoidales bacterium]
MSYRPYRRQGINPLWVIIGVTLVIFITTLINREAIYLRFGLIPALIGESPWTIFTYIFVHAGWYHIFFNMLTLFFFGTFTMSLVGETAFLITYFAGGMVGGLFYLAYALFIGNPLVPMVGASGAVYALGGLLMALRPNTRVITFPIPIPMPLWIAILVGFVMISFFPNVAWQAHLGGLLFGLAVGFYFRRREFRRY